MGMPSERILTISAKEYCDMYSKDIRDYEAVGIHLEHEDEYESQIENEKFGRLVEELANKVPDEAEVMVGYRFSVNIALCPFGSGGSIDGKDYLEQYYASGTALIPRKQ